MTGPQPRRCLRGGSSGGMRPTTILGLACLLLSRASGQVTVYTDEASFLSDLQSLGYPALHEGFEDDAVWGAVRTPQSAPAVWNQGITWTSNTPNSKVTTSHGAARAGQWGFYEIPHGDWANGIRDGWRGTGDTPLVAIGGWVRTGTPYAKLGLVLDGVPVDLGPSATIGTAPAFFGAISQAGFLGFEFVEQEATPDDWKVLFGDDFSFAFGGTVLDCNENGVPDSQDIQSGTSQDCDRNGVPDECELAFDCNQNGIPDACEVLDEVVFSSGVLSPIGDGAPQSFTVTSPPSPSADVEVTLTAYANLGGSDQFLHVKLNGHDVGDAFVAGSDCPDVPDVATLVVPRQKFESWVGGGDATFAVTASTEVNPDECDLPSTLEIDVAILVPSSADQDGDGQLDACQGLGQRICIAAPNTQFPGGAHEYAYGSPVIADDDLRLEAHHVPAAALGVHFYGMERPRIPFGDGFRCVAGPQLQAMIPVVADGEGIAALQFDLGGAPRIVAGAAVGFQFRYRDAGPTGFNLSDAVVVTFQ